MRTSPRAQPRQRVPDKTASEQDGHEGAQAAHSAPIEPATGRLIRRLNSDLVVVRCIRIHREPQMFVRVKTRKPGWCRITATPIEKGASAFAPLTRAAAYCYIRADIIDGALEGHQIDLPNDEPPQSAQPNA